MRWLVLLAAVAAAAGAAACDCSLEQFVSGERGIREATGAAQVVAGSDLYYSRPAGCRLESLQYDCALRVESPGGDHRPEGGTCWLSSYPDPRAVGDEPITWLELKCNPDVSLVFPVADLRTVEDGASFSWPIVRGAPGKGGLAETAFVDTAEPAFDPCPRNQDHELINTARISGTVEVVERSGGPSGGGDLVSGDFRTRVIVRADFTGGEGRGSGCTAAPRLGLTLEFVQTAADYAAENAACK